MDINTLIGGIKVDAFSQFKNLRLVSVDDIVPKIDYSRISEQIEEHKGKPLKRCRK